MSDGGREGRRDTVRHWQSARGGSAPGGGDEFSRAVSRNAVAQICEGIGFHGIRESALEGLADITIRYLGDLGKAVAFHANSAGRTQSNALDVIGGLEDLGMSQGGFWGASDTNHCLASSGVVKEIADYVYSADETPFAHTIPRFPVFRDWKKIPSFMQMGETPGGKHIPFWLPSLPDPHTYVHTPIWNERATDPRADKVEQAKQRRKAECSLLSLQQRLQKRSGSNIENLASVEHDNAAKNPFLATVRSAPVATGDDAQMFSASEANPFLAMPLQHGEKDVSPVVIPARLANDSAVKNHVSVLETFAPAMDVLKHGFKDSGNGNRKFLLDKRPSVHFKFATTKKLLGLKNEDPNRKASIVSHNNERDDKKTRAELILRQSMENPQELTQL